MTLTIMLTKPILLRWNFLSTATIEHDFLLSNENYGQRSLTIQIAKMIWAKVSQTEDYSPKKRVITLANSNVIGQSSSFSPSLLAKLALFANRFNQQNAPFITPSKQYNFTPLSYISPLPPNGILSSGRYTKIKTFHQQAHHLMIDKDVMTFCNIHTLKTPPSLCKACIVCPQNIIDIKGFTQTGNPSLRGNSEISVSKTGAFQIGKNQ